MLKKNKLIVFEEVNGEFIPKKNKNKSFSDKSNEFLMSFIGVGALSLTTNPLVSFAADTQSTVDDVTGGIYSTLLSLFDVAVVFVIMFAGAAWMLGHRSKAIHLLISVSCGYFIVRNAVNIRDFMRDI